MVNALLKRELGRLVQTGAMRLPEFLASDDANVIDKLPRRSRRVLQQGVDLAFPNVIGWRLSDLNRAGLELVQSPAFARKISALLARKHLAPCDFLVAVCQDYSKQLEIPIGSEGTIDNEAPVSVVVPLENRYAFVALTEDLSPSKRRQIEKGIGDCMRAFLKNPLKAALSEAEILGCQDRRLYRGRDADVELLEIAA